MTELPFLPKKWGLKVLSHTCLNRTSQRYRR